MDDLKKGYQIHCRTNFSDYRNIYQQRGSLYEIQNSFFFFKIQNNSFHVIDSNILDCTRTKYIHLT